MSADVPDMRTITVALNPSPLPVALLGTCTLTIAASVWADAGWENGLPVALIAAAWTAHSLTLRTQAKVTARWLAALLYGGWPTDRSDVLVLSPAPPIPTPGTTPPAPRSAHHPKESK